MGFEIAEDKEKRNEPCTCGSGLKFKKCHGDPAKLAVVKHVANEAMLIMIARAKVENVNIDFGFGDYDKVINNPELVLSRFNEDYGLYQLVRYLGDSDAN